MSSSTEKPQSPKPSSSPRTVHHFMIHKKDEETNKMIKDLQAQNWKLSSEVRHLISNALLQEKNDAQTQRLMKQLTTHNHELYAELT